MTSSPVHIPDLRLNLLDLVFVDEHPDDLVDVDVDGLTIGIVAILVLKTDLLNDAVEELPMLRVGLNATSSGTIIITIDDANMIVLLPNPTTFRTNLEIGAV